MKIYTKTGDKGTTSLFDGTRVSKDHLRVEAYGDVDELNAVLGVIHSQIADVQIKDLIQKIQHDLFSLGSVLANPKQKKKVEFKGDKVSFLEQKIDECDRELKPLKKFILPGGSLAASYLHLARTVCRRAERKMVTLSSQEKFDPLLIQYINRLSDLFFVLARFVNKSGGVDEIPWNS